MKTEDFVEAYKICDQRIAELALRMYSDFQSQKIYTTEEVLRHKDWFALEGFLMIKKILDKEYEDNE